MKSKYILLMLWAVVTCMMARASGHITACREYDVSSASVTEAMAPDGERYSSVALPGTWNSGAPGAPSLPYEVFQVVVPADASNIRVASATGQDKRSFQLLNRLMPSQLELTINQDPTDEDFVIPSESAYSLSSPVATVLSDGFIAGDIHVVTIGVTPVKYTDSNLTLDVYGKIDIKLEYENGGGSIAAFSPPEKGKNELYSLFRNIVDDVSAPMKAGSLTQASDPGHYFIIVPENLESGVAKLATWKKQKGYTVHIKTVESVLADSRYRIGASTYISGRTETIVDEAAALRAYLNDEFKNYGPYYCLLIGDYRTSMPIRHVYTLKELENFEFYKKSHSAAFLPTDTYFSDFTTQWDLNKPDGYDFYFTKMSVEYNPDIVIGRLLCQYPEDVESYTDKLIIYESNPGLGDNEYLNMALYFEQDMMIGNNQRVRSAFDPFGTDNTLIVQDQCVNSKVPYHPHYGGDIIKYMSQRGFTSVHGHGSPVSIATCKWWYYVVPDTEMSAEDRYVSYNPKEYDNGFNCLTNYYKPGFVYSVSCDNAPFDDYAFGGDVIEDAEGNVIDFLDNGHVFKPKWNLAGAYTCMPRVGGVAYCGNTRSGWTSASALQEANFGKNILSNPKVGVALALTKSNTNSKLKGYFVDGGNFHQSISCDDWLKHTMSLIGEPEFEMWLGQPEHLNVEVARSGQFINFSSLPSNARCVLDNFNTRTVLKGSAGNFTSPNSDYILSFWASGYQPFVRYYGVDGTLNTVHDVITTDAILGGEESDEFIIDEGGQLNLMCIESIAGNGGTTRIKQGGSACLTTLKQCVLEGVEVDNGGTLDIHSSDAITLKECTFVSGCDVFLGK
ncbi:MAG: hypothetical protein K2N09_09345 [Muribaculaceae bacterium]|nr:hypothetical protein [Muribaculaceae bacterium]